MLELASVVAAPGGFRKVDEGALESPDSGDELELSRAAGSVRRRRLFHAVGESLEFRKGLGDRAGDLGSLGLLERREQLGDPDPDGGKEAFPLTGRSGGRGELRLEPVLRQAVPGKPANRAGRMLQELVADDEGEDLR